MSDKKTPTVNCLCGAVHIHAQSVNTHVGACHCSTCRKWGGGPLLAVDCGTDVILKNEENIAVYDSSEWAERGFCSKCGTHLFYRLKQTGQYIMPAGLFEESEFEMDHQIFIDKKPAYYDFANETENMTEAQVFEKFASPQE